MHLLIARPGRNTGAGGAILKSLLIAACGSSARICRRRAMALHPTEKDKHGMPIPVVHFKDHANDVAMRNHAYKAGTAVYQSLGATQVFELPPFPSTHNMGTCRQSEKAQDGVCNKYGQAHDVANLFISDGSQFTTGGAENPTLTIVALAIRQADYLADQLSKNVM